jgi:predicted TIM-barrel fold metal-dependent hydrolase
VIIDSHVNLASDRVIPASFIQAQADNAYHRMAAQLGPVSRDRIAERFFALYRDHDGDRLISEMDDAGIARAFLVAPDFSHVAPDATDPRELAELHHRVCRRHEGRLGVFFGVDARSGEEGLALFERGITEYGFAGLKIYPLNGHSPSDRRLYPFYEVCAQHRKPVLSHTGPGWGPLDFTFGRPLLIDEAARDFPAVDFILGHGGVTHVEEAIYLCAHRPNVHMDISQFHATLSADGWQAHLNRLFRLGLNHKILFGTCWPAFRASTSLKALVKALVEGPDAFAGVKASHRQLILSRNVLRLVGEDVPKEAMT